MIDVLERLALVASILGWIFIVLLLAALSAGVIILIVELVVAAYLAFKKGKDGN